MIKKITSLTLMFLIFTLGISISPSLAGEMKKKDPVTIKILCLSGGLNTTAPLLVKKFNEFNPNSNITLRFEFADYSTLHSKIALTESTKLGTYDIYWTITDWLPEWIEGGFLEPLNQYLESDPLEGWPNIYPETVLSFQTVNEIIYGIPAHDGPYMFFYRKDLFENPTEKANFKKKYGYELALPKNLTEFKDIADFFTRTNQNLYGTSFAGNDPQATPYDLIQFAHLMGASYWDAKGNPAFNTKEWVNALKWIGKTYKENSPPGAAQIDMLGRAVMFKEGILAMYADWFGFAGYFESAEDSNVVGKVGHSLMPGDVNHDSLDIYWVWSIAASSKHKKTAWKVLRTLTGPECDKIWTIEGGGGVGVRYSTLNDPEVLNRFPFYKTMAEILDGNAFYMPYSIVTSQICDYLKVAVQDYLAGKGSAQSVLDEANRKIAEAVSEAS